MKDRPVWRVLLDQLAVAAGLGVLAWLRAQHDARPAPTPPEPVAVRVVAPIAPSEPEPSIQPSEPVSMALDEAAVARARDELERARRERGELEARRADAQEQLRTAELESDASAALADALSERVAGPSARLAAVTQRGQAIEREREAIKEELLSLANVARPRRKALIDKSPVARVAEGEEYHFEVRKDRVAFIDIERLIDKVKADAMLQMRLSSGPMVRPIASSVGPIGDFAMRYELGRDLPRSLEDAVGYRGGVASYSLRGWEVVPVRDLRGETFESLHQPASRFARTINSLNPARATITLWVYPDGFRLYRQLREVLHARGFLVAARPLPTGMAIRGSPGGSLSAGQ